MAISLYKDDACTLVVRTPQKFTRASSSGTFQTFVLTSMTGPQLGHLYRYNGVTHAKLVLNSDFFLSDNQIQLAVSLGVNEVLIAVPIDRLNLNFGGVFGSTKVSTSFVVFKRDPTFIYDNLLLSSENLDNVPYNNTFVDTAVTFVPNQDMINLAGDVVYGSRVTVPGNLGVNTLQGHAVVLNGAFIGTVLANSIDTDNGTSLILVNNVSFTHAGVNTDDLSIFSVGTLTFSLDVDGSIPLNSTFKPVLQLPNLDIGNDTVKVWVRDSLVIPEQAVNYPNIAFKLTGIEYLA